MSTRLTVGLTYDLRDDYLAMGYSQEETAEFDRPDTIDALDGVLRELGYKTTRIGHIRELARRLVAGERWDIVFNVAEGLRGVAREAQVPALLDAYDLPYTFSDPLVLALTLDKALTKRVLRDLGVPTSDFAVVTCEADVDRVRLPYPLFAKPIAEGTAKGIDVRSKIDGPDQLRAKCGELLRTFKQPVLVEPFLSGREFTVGITGTGAEAVAVGTLEVVLKEGAEPFGHTYHNKEHCETVIGYPLADPVSAREAERIALDAWRGLNCRDAGRVDLRCSAEGRMNVLELNPLAGLHPSHSDLPILCTAVEMPYLELIRRIMDSARRRLR